MLNTDRKFPYMAISDHLVYVVSTNTFRKHIQPINSFRNCKNRLLTHLDKSVKEKRVR